MVKKNQSFHDFHLTCPTRYQRNLIISLVMIAPGSDMVAFWLLHISMAGQTTVANNTAANAMPANPNFICLLIVS